jgi:hypothetical protein
MKPQSASPAAASNDLPVPQNAAAKTQPNAQGKKKQPSATSVAGRKIARKTAHSLIERRRRSKMNEEFGVLKEMIPACRGVDMHKLAILQASIEYLRYLEGCVQSLKEAHDAPITPHIPTAPTINQPTPSQSADEDTEMTCENPGLAPPSNISITSDSWQPMNPVYSVSNSTSPALGPSPALDPLGRRGSGLDLDHEATEALLALNTDRRTNRGMSVKDLLSA